MDLEGQPLTRNLELPDDAEAGQGEGLGFDPLPLDSNPP